MSVETDENLSSTSAISLAGEGGVGFGLAGWLHQGRATLADESGLDETLAGRVLAGLVTVWLAGSGYRLLKPGVDPFGELLTLHARLEATGGWLEPPDLGQALTELLARFQPTSLPPTRPDGRPWHLTPAIGLTLCRQLNELHQIKTALSDGPGLFTAWLEAANARNRAGSTKPGAPGGNDQTGPVWVDDGSGGVALVEAFDRRVTYWQNHNAEALNPASPTSDGDGQLSMFSLGEEVDGRAEWVADIPARVLADFRAAPGLHSERRRAAELTLWQTALAAYAVGRVSIFKSLPDWELR